MKLDLKMMKLFATIHKISNLCKGGILPLEFANDSNYKSTLFYDKQMRLKNGDYLIVDNFCPGQPSNPCCYFWATPDYEIGVLQGFLQPYIQFLGSDDYIVFDDFGNWYLTKRAQFD